MAATSSGTAGGATPASPAGGELLLLCDVGHRVSDLVLPLDLAGAGGSGLSSWALPPTFLVAGTNTALVLVEIQRISANGMVSPQQLKMATRIPIAFRRGPRTKKKSIDLIKTWHIFRGDKVEIVAGPHKGTQGEVVSVVRDQNKVIVENVNMSHRYVKATPAASGRSYLSPSPIHYSNVNLVDPSIGKPTRIAIRFTDEGEKVRVSKKTGTIIPKPAILKERHNPRRTGPLQLLPVWSPRWCIAVLVADISFTLTLSTIRDGTFRHGARGRAGAHSRGLGSHSSVSDVLLAIARTTVSHAVPTAHGEGEAWTIPFLHSYIGVLGRSSAAQGEVLSNMASLHEHEEAQPLTAEDQPLFDAVKAEFGDHCTDDLGIRVARAYRGVKKNREQFTLAETKKILDARAAYDVDNVLKRDLPQSKLYNEYWPTYVYGEDKEGHLVTVDRISDINPDGLFKTFSNVNDIIPHRWQYMERIQWEKVAISKRRGHRVYKHVMHPDLRRGPALLPRDASLPVHRERAVHILQRLEGDLGDHPTGDSRKDPSVLAGVVNGNAERHEAIPRGGSESRHPVVFTPVLYGRVAPRTSYEQHLCGIGARHAVPRACSGNGGDGEE
ncbi:hypothetical protein ON010_g11781 [Phytophthora cinnamomi]|nr:hypothetical protein ON010_g11781 [Phytophthora cinnamomi]